MEIIKQYLVKTQYGINLLVQTEVGEFYQQIHSTLCYDGGGAATWIKISFEEAESLMDSSTTPIN